MFPEASTISMLKTPLIIKGEIFVIGLEKPLTVSVMVQLLYMPGDSEPRLIVLLPMFTDMGVRAEQSPPKDTIQA